MDIDFEGSDTGDGKSDHATRTPTPSPSPEPSDVRRNEVFTPIPSTSLTHSPSLDQRAPSSVFPRPPVPLPPSGSGKRLGYLLGVHPSSGKVQGSGSSTSTPLCLQPAAVVAGARPKKRPSSLGGASDAKNSNKRGKATCTSGKIVNEHRSRLTSLMLETLMCSQDWLRNKLKDIQEGNQVSIYASNKTVVSLFSNYIRMSCNLCFTRTWLIELESLELGCCKLPKNLPIEFNLLLCLVC
ncbi:uncharacterized protein LOC100845742 isoform X2 [Brachypodium distachyon]|uniref:uncharacterized protein LOC100845742 isoform X2 n=1 Tax=Brachypodium distachyon TaxID=15368 RepID=UPI000530013C|nr:uncharacterized protein LOC100845742 isoform X2 [Brachypodium distachyon]|eukprot:XP_010238700.1 uncharacterized protein LOC100845742 isoform X2 [Brachypodium distachyon]